MLINQSNPLFLKSCQSTFGKCAPFKTVWLLALKPPLSSQFSGHYYLCELCKPFHPNLLLLTVWLLYFLSRHLLSLQILIELTLGIVVLVTHSQSVLVLWNFLVVPYFVVSTFDNQTLWYSVHDFKLRYNYFKYVTLVVNNFSNFMLV